MISREWIHPGLSKTRKSAPRRRQQLPEDIKIKGGTGVGGEEAQQRRVLFQDCRRDSPLGSEGTGPVVKSGREVGGGGG